MTEDAEKSQGTEANNAVDSLRRKLRRALMARTNAVDLDMQEKS
jgi:hypothetical protein